jgi:hypothetical protein
MAEAHDSLAAQGLTKDPIGHPLTYPGRLPEGSGLLDGDRYRALSEHGPPGGWRLDDATTLDDALKNATRPALADRHPGSAREETRD